MRRDGQFAAASLSTLGLGGLLFGISSFDLFAYVTAPAILVPMVTIAGVARAATIDPAVALRGE